MTIETVLRKIDISEFSVFSPPSSEAPVLEWVSVTALRIDDRFQRSLEKRGQNNVRRIAENFDWKKFSPLLLARLDGGLFSIIDGQHRAHAAAACGIETVPALISKMSLREQAAAFAWVNGTVTALTPIQIYRAALAAGEAWAADADAAVRAAGCRLMVYNKNARQKKPGEVFCVNTVRKLIDAGHAKYVTAYLLALKSSTEAKVLRWYGEAGLNAMVPALARLHVHDHTLVARFLNECPLSDIARRVEMVRASPEFGDGSFKALFCVSVNLMLKNWFRTSVKVSA